MVEIAYWGRRPEPAVYVCLSGRGRSAVATAWALKASDVNAETEITRVRASRGLKAIGSSAATQRVAEYFRLAHHDEGIGWMPSIPSSGLRRSHLPTARSPWNPVINLFALSFDEVGVGVPAQMAPFLEEHERSFGATGAVGVGLPLDTLRQLLYLMQRRWRNEAWDAGPDYDPGPRLNEILFAWGLIERMRALVKRP